MSTIFLKSLLMLFKYILYYGSTIHEVNAPAIVTHDSPVCSYMHYLSSLIVKNKLVFMYVHT